MIEVKPWELFFVVGYGRMVRSDFILVPGETLRDAADQLLLILLLKYRTWNSICIKGPIGTVKSDALIECRKK